MIKNNLQELFFTVDHNLILKMLILYLQVYDILVITLKY
jgi:hypothetical protein